MWCQKWHTPWNRNYSVMKVFWTRFHFPSALRLTALGETLCLQRFQSNWSDSFAEFRDEFQCTGVPGNSSFYENWDEVMCGGKVVVFCDLVNGRLVRCCSCNLSCFADVRCSISVRDSDVRRERLFTLPRNESFHHQVSSCQIAWQVLWWLKFELSWPLSKLDR